MPNNKYSPFVEKMHSLDLAVHAFTLDAKHLNYRDNFVDEVAAYVDTGIDGIFTDYSEATVNVLSWMGSKADFPNKQVGAITDLIEYALNPVDLEKAVELGDVDIRSDFAWTFASLFGFLSLFLFATMCGNEEPETKDDDE